VGWSEFRELLSLPRCALALRTMADLGLLQQIIPEWRRIDCLVIRDFYHRYTVDEHTLVTIQALEELAQSDLPPNQDSYRQRFASLLAELDHPELLRLALLLHDIGKGSGEEHARKSVEIARDVMARLHVPATDRDTVAFLIAHHLDLSSIMTTRDLSEISTARQLADQVESIERLKLLTLITYADISAVNPTAMTPWRLERLWQVYSTGYEEFTRELESERIRAPEQTSPEAAAFLEGFPTRYLKTHTDTQVEAHLELAHEFERRGVGLQFTRLNGTLEITVVAADRPFLFASLSGAIASFGLNILKAEAFANRNNVVLDSFIFEDPHRTIELNPEEGEKLQDVVRSAAVGKVDAAQLVAKRRRRPRPVRIRPSLRIANDVSESSTLLEIVAEDRPLLLYDLAYAISASGANIEVVLIDTEANRALDVFYITESRGKLSEDRQRALKAKLLEVCSA
jgi:[protein-PII] uridylyltransferase